MGTRTDWEIFCDRGSRVLRDAKDNKLALEEAAAFSEEDNTVSHPGLRRYLEYIIWEFGGSPGMYMEIIELLERKTSEEALVRHLQL